VFLKIRPAVLMRGYESYPCYNAKIVGILMILMTDICFCAVGSLYPDGIIYMRFDAQSKEPLNHRDVIQLFDEVVELGYGDGEGAFEEDDEEIGGLSRFDDDPEIWGLGMIERNGRRLDMEERPLTRRRR
jgi:hypothetical protein